MSKNAVWQCEHMILTDTHFAKELKFKASEDVVHLCHSCFLDICAGCEVKVTAGNVPKLLSFRELIPPKIWR